MKPGGLLILDEFVCERIDEASARWLYEIEDRLYIDGFYAHRTSMHEAVRRHGLLEIKDSDVLHFWNRVHQDEPGPGVTLAIVQHAETLFGRPVFLNDRVPYLYHYLVMGFLHRLEQTCSSISCGFTGETTKGSSITLHALLVRFEELLREFIHEEKKRIQASEPHSKTVGLHCVFRKNE